MGEGGQERQLGTMMGRILLISPVLTHVSSPTILDSPSISTRPLKTHKHLGKQTHRVNPTLHNFPGRPVT